MNKNFKEFYQSFGLSDFPFNTFTTEQETEFAKKIFVSQGEYDPIIDAFKSGRNIILLGERGSGKTAVLEDFKRHLSESDRLITTINEFSKISQKPSSQEVYRLLITNFLVDFFEKLSKSYFKHFYLNQEDKILLSYLLFEYLKPVSQNLLKDKITRIQISPFKRCFNWGYNQLRGTLNWGGTIGKNISYEYLIKHYSFLPVIENNNQIQDFFPELKLNVDTNFFDQDISFSLLKNIGVISNKIGFNKPILLLDKFDEDARFENDADLIADFIKPFLENGNLLSIKDFQIIFFVWSTPFRFIGDVVRTQKYYCPSLRWSKIDLENLLNKRLEIYSNNKLNDYRLMFNESVSDQQLEQVFELSNSNPRDIIHIFKILFEAQYRKNPNSKQFDSDILLSSLTKFVLEFNYFEYYPKKSNARANTMDIYSFSALLLKLDNAEFTKNQLNKKAGTGSSTNNYVVLMERIGLIENIKQEKGNAIYRIKDPKIIFCQKNKLELKK